MPRAPFAGPLELFPKAQCPFCKAFFALETQKKDKQLLELTLCQTQRSSFLCSSLPLFANPTAPSLFCRAPMPFHRTSQVVGMELQLLFVFSPSPLNWVQNCPSTRAPLPHPVPFWHTIHEEPALVNIRIPPAPATQVAIGAKSGELLSSAGLDPPLTLVVGTLDVARPGPIVGAPQPIQQIHFNGHGCRSPFARPQSPFARTRFQTYSWNCLAKKTKHKSGSFHSLKFDFSAQTW